MAVSRSPRRRVHQPLAMVARRPCQGRPPSPSSARRPRQGRPPSPPGSPSPPESPARCAISSARVVRRPRQDRPRPPSPPGSSAKLFLESPSPRVVRRPRQSRPPCSFFGVPTKVVHQVPASVVRRPRQSHPPSPPGSLAKLFVARPVPARVLALGDKGTQFYYCAPWLAVPNQVWQTRSAWQSKQISKR